jgi:hypothetical protein
MTDSVGALKARIEGLEEAHAFLAMYYTQRVAERLDAIRVQSLEDGDTKTANALHIAYTWVREMAKEYHDKSPVGLGDIT